VALVKSMREGAGRDKQMSDCVEPVPPAPGNAPVEDIELALPSAWQQARLRIIGQRPEGGSVGAGGLVSITRNCSSRWDMRRETRPAWSGAMLCSARLRARVKSRQG
jgi:hypothetical protein